MVERLTYQYMMTRLGTPVLRPAILGTLDDHTHCEPQASNVGGVTRLGLLAPAGAHCEVTGTIL